MKKSMIILGPVASRSGYGAHSRDICHSLISMDLFDIKIVSVGWGSTPLTALDESNEENKKILSRISRFDVLNNPPDIFVQISIPNEFQKRGIFNIGVTAGIETDLCRSEWIEGCNRMDLIIATSNHSKAVFENSKYHKMDKATNQKIGEISLTTPVEVLFEGIDLNIYKKTPPNESIYDSPQLHKDLDKIPESFNFLFVGHWLQGILKEDRKNVSGLVYTFLDTFKGSKNKPGLILKTGLAGFSTVEKYAIRDRIEQIQDLIREKRSFTGEFPNIYILYGDLSDKEMNLLYNHPRVKTMISFTKGEGFGRPLLEFGVTGKPIISSAWSGQLDFLSSEYSIPLKGELKQVHQSAANDWILPESKWFNVDYEYASLIMKNIVLEYNDYKSKSSIFPNIIKNRFSMEKMTETLKGVLEARLNSNAAPAINLPKINLPKLQIVK